MASRKKTIRSLSKGERNLFDVRLRELAEQGETMRDTAATLATEFPAVAVNVKTVHNQATARGISFKGGKALTAEVAVEQEKERLQQREMIRELQQLQRTEAKRQQYVESIRQALTGFEPTPFVALDPKFRQAPEHHWLLDLSDWHLGQYTPIQTTGGVYEQSTAITRWQIEEMLIALKSIHKVQASGQSIRKLLVVFNGDLVENDCMRASQAAKIDLFVTQQAVAAFDLAAYVLRQLLTLPGVESIEAHNVGGNHDRTTQRAGDAGLGELDYVDTYSWLIGAMLERAFENEPRISITNWETYFGYTEFAGRKVIFQHGPFRTSTGSYGGVPWYPIVDKAQKFISMLDGGDLVLFGHIHRPAVLPLGQDAWLVINGALPATSTFIQSTFSALRTPTQWLINLHREHGVIEFHPLYAPPANLKQPGHVWQEIQRG